MVPFIKSTELQTMMSLMKTTTTQQQNTMMICWMSDCHFQTALFPDYEILVALKFKLIMINLSKSPSQSKIPHSALRKQGKHLLSVVCQPLFYHFSIFFSPTLFSSRFYNNMGVNSLLTQRCFLANRLPKF